MKLEKFCGLRPHDVTIIIIIRQTTQCQKIFGFRPDIAGFHIENQLHSYSYYEKRKAVIYC